jgi:hypothetical protein
MQSKPEENIKKCETTLNAVSEIAPDSNFGGYKAAGFETKVQAMRDVRAEIDDLEAQLSAARARRDEVDAEGLEAERLVVNGIIGDPNFGPDSPLYGASGRTRKSDRKSGLTRKKKTVVQP